MAAAPQFSNADYAAAFRALMPRGAAWWADPTAVMTKVCAAMAPSFTRANMAAAALLVGAFPPTAVAMLPEWEAALGLPDPCSGTAPTLQGRQDQVLARFADTGGQSVAFFTALALTLGYAITIAEYTDASGDAHHWQVTAPAGAGVYFRAGMSTAGELIFSGLGGAVLECVFQRLKPAQTTVSFVYV